MSRFDSFSGLRLFYKNLAEISDYLEGDKYSNKSPENIKL